MEIIEQRIVAYTCTTYLSRNMQKEISILGDYDVAIVGAGPSGCSAALELRNSGLKVLILDKDAYPRDKVCGDAIPGLAFKAMDAIDKSFGEKMRAFTDSFNITTSKLYVPNGKSASIDWVLYSYNSKRESFDNFLMQLVKTETKTEILENSRVQNITKFNAGFEIELKNKTRIKAKMIIGCDGANSIVNRQIAGFSPQKGKQCIAVRAYYEGVEALEIGVNEFFVFKELLPGYLWIFPLPNGACNVGFGLLQEKNKLENSYIETLDSALKTIPLLANRFKNAKAISPTKGFSLPIWNKKRPISGDGFILCGDAASLIDPLQGHGIDKAMWSGVFAAQQVQSCFSKSVFSASEMKNYDSRVYKKFGSELRRNAFLVKVLIFRPRILNLLGILSNKEKTTNWLARTFKF